MTWTSGPAATRLRLGAELRRLRESEGLTLEDVARKLECSPSKISRLEIGKGLPRWRDVRDLLDILEVADIELRERLLAWSRGGQGPGWWNHYADLLPAHLSTYFELEWDASRLEAFEPTLVHGLLQTRDYARAVLTSAFRAEGAPPEAIERRVDLRMSRQETLTSDHGLAMSCVLDESALYRRVGSEAIMRGQLEHLLGLTEAAHIEVRILLFAAGPVAPAVGSFSLLRFSEGISPDVIFLERTPNAEVITSPDGVKFYDEQMRTLAQEAYTPEESGLLIKRILGRPA